MTFAAADGPLNPRHAAMSRRHRRRLIAALAIATVFAGLGGTAGWFFSEYRAYVVHTGSMSPGIVPGDVVVERRVTGAIAPGDVITFRASESSSELVTHRVASIAADGSITTKGDANQTADPVPVNRDQVQGKVSGRVAGAGYLVVYLQHPMGLMSLATSVFCVVLLWQVFFPTPRPEPSSPAMAVP
ncbi:MAG TPA: signal peptidase I [Cellulomonas sp.]